LLVSFGESLFGPSLARTRDETALGTSTAAAAATRK